MTNPLSRRVRTTLFYALRAAFRLTPMPQATRDRLRQRFLDTRGDWVPEGPKGKAPDGALPRRPYVRSDERAIGYVPYEKGELPDPLPATLVAFYLPQFHTIPENDAWWGKGFTEWRNVTRALPQFEGHYQPKLPGDLGFYDLRNVEVMHEQARLAREYGISAFCFYFYWFGGKTLLETPLRNWLNDKTIDLKFCLCWANEKWTRTWDGRGNEVLIDQQHSPEDDIAFIEYVAEYMRDPRYLRVDGKPMLLVYRPGLLPSADESASRWRAWCEDHDIGAIHLVYVQSFDRTSPSLLGFDAATQFPPNFFEAQDVTATQQLINPEYRGNILDWRALRSAAEADIDATVYRGIATGWDNEARRPGRGRTFINSFPSEYQSWLGVALTKSIRADSRSPLIFVNAWNEWAEGTMLEPCARRGYALLSSTRLALIKASSPEKRDWAHAVVHVWYLDVLEHMLPKLLTLSPHMAFTFTTTADKASAVRLMTEKLFHRVEVIVFENRGRDVLPFLIVANRLVQQGKEWVLKLHTKKSPHLASGDEWREHLISDLIPSDIDGLLQQLHSDDTAGIIAPDGHLLALEQYVGANGGWLRKLGVLPRATNEDTQARFPAGSMYWGRLDALQGLLDTDLCASDFESEDGQIDGTLAHALERAIGAKAGSAGYSTVTMSQFRGGHETRAPHYRYAAKAPDRS
ncbi:MAG TPA: glycoside hydrolase family 99-like domain-containing protein [Pseudoxanthomonas sp.]